MTVSRIVACVLVGVLAGCGLGNDEGEQVALKLVQEFKPTPSATPIIQMLKTDFSQDEWSVLKTSEGLYRVTVQGQASGKTKELVFGVSINKRHVMGLNRDALAYTNRM
jgi:hypothetical protein